MIRNFAYKLKRVYIAGITTVASFRQRLFSLHARRALLREGFSLVRKLGAGKDGVTFLCRKDGVMVITKYLSSYGRAFLPLTKAYIKKHVQSPHLYVPVVTKNSFLEYPSEDLREPEINSVSFWKYLLQLCALEKSLIEAGMVYWDFGFSSAPNYMMTSEGVLKIIDYGGNAFLFLKKSDYEEFRLESRERRRNLVTANTSFIAIQLLLHIIIVGLGKRGFETYPSIVQNASDSEIARIRQICINEIKGTSYETVGNTAIATDLTTTSGWDAVAQSIHARSGEVVSISEQADIDTVEFIPEGVRVVGYQSYVIEGDHVKPLQNEKADDLWDTTKKMSEVVRALDIIEKRHGRAQDFLDLGSNLGLYVFLAKKKYHITHAIGVDYNPAYVQFCNEITTKLRIDGCDFLQGTFGSYTGKHDVVLALGLVHHLYHRTEDFGSLEKILKRFADMTKQSLIIEFPTEKDAKAQKWTNMPFRKKGDEYSLAHFEDIARRFFKTVEKIGGTSPTRPMFLLEK